LILYNKIEIKIEINLQHINKKLILYNKIEIKIEINLQHINKFTTYK